MAMIGWKRLLGQWSCCSFRLFPCLPRIFGFRSTVVTFDDSRSHQHKEVRRSSGLFSGITSSYLLGEYSVTIDDKPIIHKSVSRICSSLSVEESVADGFTGGFAYYMDERDKDWLDKNNKEACGEGRVPRVL
jgi:hypothetical protein